MSMLIRVCCICGVCEYAHACVVFVVCASMPMRVCCVCMSVLCKYNHACVHVGVCEYACAGERTRSGCIKLTPNAMSISSVLNSQHTMLLG